MKKFFGLIIVLMAGLVAQASFNQVPFNSFKDLQIKGLLATDERAILVFELDAVDSQSTPMDINIMTQHEKTYAAKLAENGLGVRVSLAPNGDVTLVHDLPEKAVLIGKISKANVLQESAEMIWLSGGQLLDEAGALKGQLIGEDGQVLKLVTQLDGRIASLTGSGAEVVVAGQKVDFVDSIAELNGQHSESKPVVDLKVSSLSSVLQVEIRNETESEAFATFRFMNPSIVAQINEFSQP